MIYVYIVWFICTCTFIYTYVCMYVHMYTCTRSRVLLPLLRMPREGASPTRICPDEPNEPKKKTYTSCITVKRRLHELYNC